MSAAVDTLHDTPTARPRRWLFSTIGAPTPRGALRDVLAGLTLAAMNVPQALGYTKIAGMPVVTGLYTLLLPLVGFAAFGSSRYLVVSADSATAAILAGQLSPMAPIASERYVQLASQVALLTAGFLLLARLLKLGFLADFLSQTVLVGFLTGVGVQVGIAVLGDMLGLAVDGHTTVEQVTQLVREVPNLHPWTVAISASVVAVVLACRVLAPRLPGPLFAVVGAIVASMAADFADRGIRVIGPMPGGLPGFWMPGLNWNDLWALLPVAASCFVMIVAQSAATARIYAVRHRQPLDENADLVGLATANAGAAFTGTFVVNGSPTQTAMVDASGGRSQIVHLTTAAVVVFVLLFLTGPLAYLPRCVLGAIVFTIAVGMIDVRALRNIGRESPGEFHLAVGTALVVVLVGVEQGIVLAMVISLFRHVRHSYRPHTAVLVEGHGGHWLATPAVAGAVSKPGIVIFRFGADLFYANADRFADDVHLLVEGTSTPPHWLIVDAGAITSIDYSAARVARSLLDDLNRDGVTLLLVHVPPTLRDDLERHQLIPGIGADHIFETLHEALGAIDTGTVRRAAAPRR